MSSPWIRTAINLGLVAVLLHAKNIFADDAPPVKPPLALNALPLELENTGAGEVGSLLIAATAGEETTRITAFERLTHLDGVGVFHLGSFISNPNPAVRRKAAEALLAMDRRRVMAVGSLTPSLDDKDPEIRAMAIYLIGMCSGDNPPEVFTPNLHAALLMLLDGNASVRSAAVMALRRLSPDHKWPTADWIADLRSFDPNVFHASIERLLKLDPQARPRVVDLLEGHRIAPERAIEAMRWLDTRARAGTDSRPLPSGAAQWLVGSLLSPTATLSEKVQACQQLHFYEGDEEALLPVLRAAAVDAPPILFYHIYAVIEQFTPAATRSGYLLARYDESESRTIVPSPWGADRDPPVVWLIDEPTVLPPLPFLATPPSIRTVPVAEAPTARPFGWYQDFDGTMRYGRVPGPETAANTPEKHTTAGELIDQNPDLLIATLDLINDSSQYRLSVLIEVAFTHSDEKVVVAGAQAAGRVGPRVQSLRHGLIGCLSHSSAAVRDTASEALDHFNLDVSTMTTAMLMRLEDPRCMTRCHAATMLGKLGEKAAKDDERIAIALLRHVLTGNDCEAATASTAFVQLGHRPVAPLLAVLNDKDNLLARQRVIGLMGQLGYGADQLVAPLLVIIRDHDDPLQLQAIAALGKLGVGRPATFAALLKMAGDTTEFPRLRKEAVVALSQVSPKEKAIAELLEFLKDDTLGEVAATTLIAMGPEGRRAAAGIAPLLFARDAETRHRLLKMLGQLHEDAAGAVPTLVKMLEEKNVAQQLWVGETLSAIGPAAKPATSTLAKVIGESRRPVAAKLVVDLAHIDPDHELVAERLIEAVKQKDYVQRVLLAPCLKGSPAARGKLAAALHQLLRDPDDGVRTNAYYALHDMGIEVVQN